VDQIAALQFTFFQLVPFLADKTGIPFQLTIGWIERRGKPIYQHAESLFQRFVEGKTDAWLREGCPFHLWWHRRAGEILDVLFAMSLGWAKTDIDESFSAFGQRRNPSTWSGAPTSGDLTTIAGLSCQGYTFHSWLGQSMGLNHMNGRVEDALLGRMVSADPYIPDPTNAQSYNRYSYVKNNPVTMMDPTGFADPLPMNPQDGPNLSSGSNPSSGSGGDGGTVPDRGLVYSAACRR
jgi:RHS repeat-associated protein